MKEAIVKASGSKLIYFPGVFLKKNGDSKPSVEIEGEVNKKILFEELQISQIHASISHEDLFAIAFVMLETTRAVE